MAVKTLEELKREVRPCPVCGGLGPESPLELIQTLRAFIERVSILTRQNHERMNDEMIAALDDMERIAQRGQN